MTNQVSGSYAGNAPIWMLGVYDVSLPAACSERLSSILRIEDAQQPVSSRSLSAAAVYWDRKRVERAVACDSPSLPISLRSAVERISNIAVPVIVTLDFDCAREVSRLLRREVYWVSIDGRGATDRSAVWMSWLEKEPSFFLALARITTDRKEEIARREYRNTFPTPALGHWDALRGSVTFIEQVSSDSSARNSVSRIVPNPPDKCVCSDAVVVGRRPSTRKVLRQILKNRLQARLHPSGPDRWAIGTARVKARSTCAPEPPEPSDCHWIEHHGDGFLADPFLVELGDRTILFFEELDYSSWRGRLKMVDLDGDGRPVGPSAIVLEKPYHLSFPNVFRCEDDLTGIYLLPEQAKSGRTVLYRARIPDSRKPFLFEVHATLLDSFPGVDPVLHWYPPYWWLFVTDGSHGNHDNNLHLFMAPELRGPYVEHPASPICLGLRGSRMAGQLLTRYGSLFRIGQNCQRRYGEKMILFRIEELSAVGYRETEIQEFECDPSLPKFAGMHSLSFTSSLVAIDVLLGDHTRSSR